MNERTSRRASLNGGKTGFRRTRFFTFHRSSYLFSALLWLVALVLFFSPVVFQGKVLAPLDILDHLMRPWSDGAGGFGVQNAFVYDAISQYLPYDWTICQSIKQDGYIGWNPYVYGGYALLENTMLCPGDWHHQLYRFFDFWTAWDLGIVLQFAIAGFGVLLMLRAEGMPAWAAFAGTLSFAFYSQHVIWIYHRWVLGASCWFPWIVWAVRRARRKNQIFDFWSVVFAALAFRGGSLQSCLFVATLVFCLFLSDWWQQPARWTPQTFLRSALPYAVLAVLSSVLILDVLLDTVPPFLEGCRQLPQKSLLKALLALPTLIAALHPTLLGTPQTLDAFKIFGCALFDLKFVGAISFILALFALFRRHAPGIPRLLFAVSLAIPFTPLTHWFYSRSTVLFALGCSWLFAWTLANLQDVVSDRAWRNLACCGATLSGIWLLASIPLILLAARLAPALHRFVEKSLSEGKASRHDWMLVRADAFLAELPIWNPHNLILIFLVTLGLFAAWRLARSEKRHRWIAVLVLCSFGELFVWSRTWITFYERPAPTKSGLLYPEQDWTRQLRKEMQDGGFLWMHGGRPDFDYLQLNSQAGIGIPSIQGYETIKPASLRLPDNIDRYESVAFANIGVSHVLVLPGVPVPDGLTNWVETIDSPDLHLFRNSAFDSRWHAVLSDGTRVPLSDLDRSFNRHRFYLPADTVTVLMSEPFHPAWSNQLPPGITATTSRRDDGGTIISFDHPLDAPAELVRSFHKRNWILFPQRILLVLLAILSLVPSDIEIAELMLRRRSAR